MVDRSERAEVATAVPVDALAAAFDRHYGPMVNLGRWLTGSRELGEELAREAFVGLAVRGADGIDNPAAYLRTSMVNLNRSRGRRLQRRSGLVQRLVPGLRHEPPADRNLPDESLAAAITALPARQRECVVLRYSQDLAVDEIAAALGISAGSVKTHLHRALRRLERELVPGPIPVETPETDVDP